MPLASWLVDTDARLQRLAKYYTDDTNEACLWAGRAMLRLLQRRQSFDCYATAEELAAALREAAQGGGPVRNAGVIASVVVQSSSGPPVDAFQRQDRTPCD